MKHISAVLSALLISAAADAEDEQLILTTDPFRKPEFEQIEPQEPIALEEQTESRDLPRLRAIMHSPHTTLVNLDGELVAIGARFGRFLVAAAGERDVVLLKGDDNHVISLDDEAAEGDRDD